MVNMNKSLEEFQKHSKILQSALDDLTERFDDLKTFQEAAQWDSDAKVLIHLFEQLQDELKEYITDQNQLFNDAKSQRQDKSILKRTFGSRTEEKEPKKNIKVANKVIAYTENIVEYINEMIGRIPGNKKEQKEMKTELSKIKKELTHEKREINERIKQIRIQAKQSTSSISGFTGGYARYKKSNIRFEKERALAPDENAKAALERQIKNIEKMLNWVRRFSGENPVDELNVIRCSYCGRRVSPGVECPGCGSYDTITGN
jgi:Rad3-related DNA helicase